MVRYKKKGPVLRLPQEFIDSVGSDLELAADYKTLVIYSEKEAKQTVINSLKVLIKDLQLEIEVNRKQKN